MILREAIPILIACCCLSPAAAQEVSQNALPTASSPTAARAQDFNNTVLPITALRVGIRGKSRIGYKPSLDPLSYIEVQDKVSSEFGTGFCVDPACRFIGTNYHVAINLRPRKINGEKVIQQYFATGPDDEGATVVEGLSLMKYNLTRDLAIFELRHSLPHHHGIAFSLDDLQVGQEVDIYAYPKEQSIRRSLRQFYGTYEGQTVTGLLAFGDFHDKAIRGGASGGIVVDRKTQQIVGILSGTAGSNKSVALAVPIQSLAEFVSKVQPYLAQRVFPHRAKAISPVSADLYPKFVPSPPDALQHRAEDPLEVRELRGKAQLLADSMRNFIAVQTFAWGSGDKEEPAAVGEYEVQVMDGYQRFREYPDGRKALQNVPFPPLNNAFVPGGEWSELPGMVGTRLQLRIHQATDAVVNERRMKVFQYRASAEDGLCTWKVTSDFGFFEFSKTIDSAVYGEVWTDEDMNILRMSEHCEIPDTFQWKGYQAVVTYGWLKHADGPPRLVPLTIYAQAEHKKKIYWCRGQFTNYRVFSTRVKVLAGENTKAGSSH